MRATPKSITDAVQYLFSSPAGQRSVRDGLGYIAGTKPLTAGSIFNMVGFAVLHPIHTFNLVRLGRSPDIYNSSEFQKKVLKPESTIWPFLNDFSKEGLPRQLVEKYDIKAEILEVIPLLNNHGDKLVDIYTSIRTDSLMVWIEKTVDMVIEDKQLKDFVSNNPTAISTLAKSLIENISYAKASTQTYNFDTEILDILDIILVKPEEAAKILKSYNKGEYKELTKAIINLTNDKDIGENLSLKLQEQAGLFTKLTQGILEQDEKYKEKENLSDTYKSILKNYGISDEGIAKLGDALEILLENPKELQKVFGHFEKGDYAEMVIEIFSIAESNPKIGQFVKNNKEIFTPIVKEIVNDLPQVQRYSYGADISEIVMPIVQLMLDNPGQMKKVIDESKNGTRWSFATTLISSVPSLMTTAFAKEMATGITQSLYGVFGGKGREAKAQKQEILDAVIADTLKEPHAEKINLSQLLQDMVKDLEEKDPEGAKKLNKLIGKNLFSLGTIDNADFTSVIVDGQSFVNSTVKNSNFANTTIENAYFMGASCKNVNFLGVNFVNTSFAGAKFENTVFREATIDRNTLESILPQLKQGYISLEGVNLRGDLSNLDLSGISLQDVNLSRVTSLEGANVHNTNIMEANFGNNIALKNSLALEMWVSDVANKIFGEGHNRVSDFNAIRSVLNESLNSIGIGPKDRTMQKLIDENHNYDLMLNEIVEKLKAHSKYTTPGLITGGIYLPEGLEKNEELMSNIDKVIEQSVGESCFSKEELNIIERIAKKIAENLFGSGAEESRKEDSKLISDTLKENFYLVKKASGEDLASGLEQREQNIIGEKKVSTGWVTNTTEYTGLTKLFYDNSQYTKAGLVTGGIKLSENKIKSEEFSQKVSSVLEKEMAGGFRGKIRESQNNPSQQQAGRV